MDETEATGGPGRPRALDGIRVIDLTTVVAGPTCTQLLGDHGADVIKVEAPHGDDSRDVGPPVYGDFTAHFAGLNRGKRALALDLSKAEGRDVLMRLLADADVLAENFKPGTLEGWGLGYDDVLSTRFPRLIHAHITGFGGDGPLGGLPGYDVVAQAFSGIMSFCGEADGDPLRVGLNIVDTATGLHLALAILLALEERHRTGRGQTAEVTLLDVALTLMHPFAANYLMAGVVPKRLGNRHPNGAPFDVFPVRDGHVIMCVINNRQFRKMCGMLGRPELGDDPRFKTNADRVAHVDALGDELKALLKDRDKVELCLDMLRNGVMLGPVLDLSESLENPQVAAREMIVDSGDGLRVIGTPIKLGRTPGRMSRLPPRFAEHNREILREAGFGDAEIDALIEGRVIVEERG
ncbi:MAG: CaiB/BaiF CoA transferase family protein [Alphaproteobacteria bacterium]